MIDYKQLAQAAFDNDCRSDEGIGIEAILVSLGADPEGVRRVAEQRALRLVLAGRGPAAIQRMKEMAYSGERRLESLNENEQAKMMMLIPIWIDGLSTGLKVVNDGDN